MSVVRRRNVQTGDEPVADTRTSSEYRSDEEPSQLDLHEAGLRAAQKRWSRKIVKVREAVRTTLGLFGVALGGVILGVSVIGPGWGRGYLLNLDLVSTPSIPVPLGLFGLGPDLPRRVPFGLVFSWLSVLVGGSLATKLILTLLVAIAFVGLFRFCAFLGASWSSGVLFAAVYAAGPFAVTRLAVGHWHVLATLALLPWVIRLILDEESFGDSNLRALFVGLGVLALSGVTGGTIALITFGVRQLRRDKPVVSLIAESPRLVLSQAPWLVPGLVVIGAGVSMNGSGYFPTRVGSPVDFLKVVIGYGFWRTPNQVGQQFSLLPALLALIVVAAAFWGRRQIAQPLRLRLEAGALTGLFLTLASGLWGIRTIYGWLVDTPFGGPLRDSQRFFVLWLLWLCVAAALGVDRLVRSLGSEGLRLVAAAGVILVVAPCLWGAGNQLRPAQYPENWALAEKFLSQHPGAVLAYPFGLYRDTPYSGYRRILSPFPDYFGNEIFISRDPGGRTKTIEGLDPRLVSAPDMLDAIKFGAASSDGLNQLGVRYVLVSRELDWDVFVAGLVRDPNILPVFDSEDVEIFEVTNASSYAKVDWIFSWLGKVKSSPDPETGLRIARPFQKGWVLGLRSIDSSSGGILEIPSNASHGILIFWPAVICLASLLFWTLFLLKECIELRRRT